jgi:hypothetical protein
MDDMDKYEIADHANKLINHYVKNNFDKILEGSKGSTIDILDLMNLKPKNN